MAWGLSRDFGCGKGSIFDLAGPLETAKNGLHNECDTWNSVERSAFIGVKSRGRFCRVSGIQKVARGASAFCEHPWYAEAMDFVPR